MVRKFSVIGIVIALCVIGLSACQSSQPETIVETVIVEKEGKTVVETVEVEKVVALEDINVLTGVSGILDVQYAEVAVPMHLGWYQNLGYSTDLMSGGGTLEVIQQLVAGNIEITQGNIGAFVQAIIQEDAPLVIFFQEGVVSWALAVPADSDITKPEDFAGKTIGVYSLSSGGIPLLEGYLNEYGISTDQYEMIAVGWGPQASDALTAGDIDAIMLWGGALANLENLGHDLRYFRSDTWDIMPDYGFATSRQYFEENRDAVVGFSKGLAMGLIFEDTNPDCALRVTWDAFPESKPVDMSEEDMYNWDMTVLTHNFQYYKTAYEKDPSGIWGYAGVEEFDLLEDYLLEQGMIDKKVDPATFLPDAAFWDEINDFDHQAIVDLATACDY